MSILKNSVVVSLGTLTSRVLGLVRDMLMAGVLGAGAVSDAFFVALKTPNLIRNLLAEGALNVSFVPLLSKHMNHHQPTPEAESFANSVFSALLVLLTGVSVVGVLAMPVVITAVAPGFLADPTRFDMAVVLGRIMFPYLVFIILANFIGATLNTMGRFAAMAFIPALLNLSFIAFLVLAKSSADPAPLVAWAVPIGGVLQLALMGWLIRRTGFKLVLKRPHHHPEMPLLLRRLGPATLGVGVQLINGVVDGFFASMLAVGSVSYLFYAERLNLLPVALIGIAVSTALLPDLSRALHAKNDTRAAESFSQSLVACFALGLAASIGLMTLSQPIMHLIYQRGAFSFNDASQTAYTLMAFALGLPAIIATKITATAFYAHGDTKTPMRFAVIALLVNIGFIFIFMHPLKHVGLALSTALSAWVMVMMHLRTIHHRGLFTQWHVGHTLKNAAQALGMGLVMWLVLQCWMFTLPWPDAKHWQALWLGGAIGTGGVIYLGGLQLLGLFDLRPLWQKLSARLLAAK